MSRSVSIGWCGSLAVAALALAGCGSAAATAPPSSHAAAPGTGSPTATPASNAAAAHPCSLITTQEASAALGVDAGTGSGYAGQCDYATASGSVMIIETQYPDGSTANSSFAGTQTAAQAIPGFQNISGIGDHAFLTSGLVEFTKGSTVVIIHVLGPNPTTAVMTTLGQAAAGRV